MPFPLNIVSETHNTVNTDRHFEFSLIDFQGFHKETFLSRAAHIYLDLRVHRLLPVRRSADREIRARGKADDADAVRVDVQFWEYPPPGQITTHGFTPSPFAG